MNKEQRLTPIKFFEYRGKKRKVQYWLYQCSCGNKKVCNKGQVSAGQIRSCGCLARERKHQITHGLSRTRFAHIFKGIKQRCEDKNCKAYLKYGKRGTKTDWKNVSDFKRDMYNSYLRHVTEFGEADTTIDRIDNYKGYSKENCRWATRKEQAHNRTIKVKRIKFGNNYLSYAEIGLMYNLNQVVVNNRIKLGWSKKDFDFGKKISVVENEVRLLKKLFIARGHLLSEKQRAIISIRTGMLEFPKTLQEVADIFGVSRQRIKQIEDQSIQKMMSN